MTGRRCAWCSTVLPTISAAWSPASDAICRGCFEDLEDALAESGLRCTPQASQPSLPPASPVLGVPVEH